MAYQIEPHLEPNWGDEARYKTDMTGAVTGLLGPQNEEIDIVTSTTNPVTGGVELNGKWSVPWSSQNVIKTVLIGDSFTVLGQGGAAQITAVARTNNVATATTASTAGFRALNPATVFNMLDASFNASDVPMTIIDATHFSYPSVGSDGSTTNLSANAAMSVVLTDDAYDEGAFSWLKAKSGGVFELVHNAGANGQTAAQMLARFEADILAYAGEAKLLIIQTGYNDFALGSRSALDTYTDVKSMAVQGVNAGFEVLIEPAAPWASGVNTAYLKVAMDYNRMLMNFCNQTPNVRFANTLAYLVNATSTTFAPIAGMLKADNIHPSARGAERRGQAYWDVLQYDVPRPSRFMLTLADTPANNATGYVKAAGPFANSGGSLSGTASGTVCSMSGSGCYVAGSGSGTVVASPQAGFDGVGYNQRVVFTPAAAADTASIISGGYTVTVVPGTRIQFKGKLSLSGLSAANIRSIDWLTNAAANFSKKIFGSINPGASTLYSQTDQTLSIVSNIFTVPAGVTAIAWNLVVTAAGAGSALTFELGEFSIEEIPAL